MSEFQVPNFLRLKDEKLLYDGDGELLLYVPDAYFTDSKEPYAEIIGESVSTFGLIDWALVSPNGKVGESKPFMLPTIFTCKPTSIEKVKDLSLKGTKKRDYRVLHFKHDAEVISDINVAQFISNVMKLFNLLIVYAGKTPNTIPYDKIHEYLPKCMELNGSSFNLNMQIVGILMSESCRNPHNLAEPFRFSKMNDMTDYVQVSIKNLPKYISPYVAFTSENFDESLMAAVLNSDEAEENIKHTPLEKVLMN